MARYTETLDDNTQIGHDKGIQIIQACELI